MKLEFESSPLLDARERGWFERAFPVAIRELGIFSDAVVRLRVSQSGVVAVLGAATDRISDGLFRITFAPLGLLLNARSNIAVSFAHELVHVRQFLSGCIQVTDSGVYWRGDFYDGLRINKLQRGGDIKQVSDGLPWEEEAYRISPQVGAVVMAEVDDAPSPLDGSASVLRGLLS